MSRKIGKVLGWVLVILGILGFFSNPIIGSSAGAFFASNSAGNILHLVLGFALIWGSMSGGMRMSSQSMPLGTM